MHFPMKLIFCVDYSRPGDHECYTHNQAGRETSKSQPSTSSNTRSTATEMLTLQQNCEYAPDMLPMEHKHAVTTLGLD
jgi:hypothetical protein